MKKLIITAAILISCLSVKVVSAQITFGIGINIGNQPDWGPVGYAHADYYYMPDIDAYYDVSAHTYIYNNNGAWVRSNNLPPRYHDYDVYHGYKVVVNHPRPWMHAADYRARYAGYRGRHDQQIIRDSHDDRYRNHWHGDGQGNGHFDNGRDQGNHGDNRNHGDRGARGHDNGWHGDQGDHGHGHN